MTYSLGAKRRPPCERPHAVGGFAAQQRLHLLRDDRSAEDPGKSVTDGRPRVCARCAEPSHVTASPPSAVTLFCGARVSPHCVFLLHGIGRGRHCGTSRTLRIRSDTSAHGLITSSRRFARRRGSRLGMRGHYSDMLRRLFRASGGMADALASGASVLRDVGVQVPLRPPVLSRFIGDISSPAVGRGFCFGTPVRQ